MRPYRYATIAACAFGLGIGGLAHAAGAPTKWTPAPTMDAKLGTFQPCDAYELRPPKGFTLIMKPASESTTGCAWISPVRKDGTRGYVMVVFATPSPEELQTHTLTDVLNHFVAGIGERRTGFKTSTVSLGTIDGITFARTYWSGADSSTGAKMHGFVYAAVDGPTVLEISSQDFDRYSKTSLPRAEASARSFRKQIVPLRPNPATHVETP